MSIVYDRKDLEGKQENKTGQHESYLALSPEERAKGFVRPVRQTYVHKGIHLCGQFEEGENRRCRVCSDEPGHGGACFQNTVMYLERMLAKKVEETQRLGCGVSTKMNIELAETYATNPKFYSHTFCVGCNKHLPVEEFEWEDGEVVGS